MDETLTTPLIDAVIALAISTHGDIHLSEKYGGSVLMTVPDEAANLVGGVFASKGHVSVEFSHGITFDAPNGPPEGNGNLDDKDVADFPSQALAH